MLGAALTFDEFLKSLPQYQANKPTILNHTALSTADPINTPVINRSPDHTQAESTDAALVNPFTPTHYFASDVNTKYSTDESLNKQQSDPSTMDSKQAAEAMCTLPEAVHKKLVEAQTVDLHKSKQPLHCTMEMIESTIDSSTKAIIEQSSLQSHVDAVINIQHQTQPKLHASQQNKTNLKNKPTTRTTKKASNKKH